MTTLKDIAEKSGFSVTTVSRALAGYSDVNPRTRQLIEAIAQAEGYQPNVLARQLRARRTDTIGLILPASHDRFTDDFFNALVMSIGYAATQHQLDLLISAKPPEQELDAYRRIVGGNRVDGVILARIRQHDPRIAYLKMVGHPFVVFGRAALPETSDFAYVDVDSRAGIQMMVQHLAQLGHQRMALLLPPPTLAMTLERLTGFEAGLAAAGLVLNPQWIVHGDLTIESGERLTTALLAQHPSISAIVASNDLMALGAMRAAQAAGRQVGVDLAVTGYDNIAAAAYAHPMLTTVAPPLQEIGQRLVALLMSILHRETPAERQVLLPPTLIVRESCGANAVGKEIASPQQTV
ncbi:MAG: LacI family DNA-binding transcriptional regulator [Aggregatilineales bacterium]